MENPRFAHHLPISPRAPSQRHLRLVGDIQFILRTEVSGNTSVKLWILLVEKWIYIGYTYLTIYFCEII